jgi:hypothetical protein
MPIMNYTTSITAEKTVMEIQKMLQGVNATAILTEYKNGVLSAMSFRINTEHGELSFRLPAKVEAMFNAMYRDPKIPRGLKTMQQASRVTWRVIKDGLQAQLAWIAAGLTDLPQVFLAYLQGADGETLYETMKARQFTGLALTNTKS